MEKNHVTAFFSLRDASVCPIYLQSAFALPLVGDTCLHPLVTQISPLIPEQLLSSNSVISLAHNLIYSHAPLPFTRWQKVDNRKLWADAPMHCNSLEVTLPGNAQVMPKACAVPSNAWARLVSLEKRCLQPWFCHILSADPSVGCRSVCNWTACRYFPAFHCQQNHVTRKFWVWNTFTPSWA